MWVMHGGRLVQDSTRRVVVVEFVAEGTVEMRVSSCISKRMGGVACAQRSWN